MAVLSALDTGRLRGRAVVRDPDEPNRSSSPLELLFDLTFVVAVNQASGALEHELLVGHVRDGIIGFTTVFLAVWWAWMNYTWFNTAHDADDLPHRLLTLVQMAGVLVLAAGVTPAVEDRSLVVVTIGYGIMRVGLIVSWLRVARDVPDQRTRALRFAIGLTALQVLWFGRLALPDGPAMVAFVVLFAGELLVPMWAERAAPQPIFHPEHIEERYGLFTIIVLGESILSATAGFRVAVSAAGLTPGLLAVGIGGLVLAFAAWWIYFDHPGHLTPSPAIAFRWGYAHVVVFASLTAMGAGIHVAADTVAAGEGGRVAPLAVALPVAGYLLGLALIMAVTGTPLGSPRLFPKLLGATVVAGIGLVLPAAVVVVACAAVLTALAVSMMVVAPPGRRSPTGDGSSPARVT
ncbi:MAG TPA: low temperature requirement protein A [Acidimicrobiales bacterium]|jgi:low temperature requirement protein LtrA